MGGCADDALIHVRVGQGLRLRASADGRGGSAAFADPDSGIAVGFTTDVAPAQAGASQGFLALLATLRHSISINGGHL